MILKYCHGLILVIFFLKEINVSSGYGIENAKKEIEKEWQFDVLASAIRDSVLSVRQFPWDLVNSLKNSSIDSTIEQIIQFELPFVIPAGIGFLAAVIVPLIGMCLCRVQSSSASQGPGMWLSGIFLTVFIGIGASMGFCILYGGERLLATPRPVVDTVNASLNDVPLVLQNFLQDLQNMILEETNNTLHFVRNELTALPNTLSGSMISDAYTFINSIETGVNALGQDSSQFQSKVSDVMDTITTLEERANDLKEKKNDLENAVRAVQMLCYPPELQADCDDTATTTDNTDDIDENMLTDFRTDLNDSFNQISVANFTSYTSMDKDSLDTLPDMINNASSSQITDVLDSIDGVQDELEPMLEDMINSILPNASTMTANSLFGTDDIMSEVYTYVDLVEQHSQFGQLGFYTMGLLVIVPCLLCLYGIVCVCCCAKTDPEKNKGQQEGNRCGVFLLKLPNVVGISFLFYYFMFGSLFLVIGTNLTIVCVPLQDLSVFDEFLGEDGFLPMNFSLQGLFPNMTSNITIKGLLQGCQGGGTVFTLLNLLSLVNVSDLFNTDMFEINTSSIYQTVNDSIRNISLVDSSERQNMMSDLGFENMNDTMIDTVLDQLRSLESDREQVLLKVKQLQNGFSTGTPDRAAVYANLSTAISNFESSDNNFIESTNTLEERYNSLNDTMERMKMTAESVTGNLTELENYLQAEAAASVIQATENQLESLKSVPNNFENAVKSRLSTDVGRCTVIGDIYNTVAGSICVYFLSGFNVFWAGLYLGAVFLTFVIITASKLSTYTASSPLQMGYRHRTVNIRSSHRKIVPTRTHQMHLQASSLHDLRNRARKRLTDKTKHATDRMSVSSYDDGVNKPTKSWNPAPQVTKRTKYHTGSGSPQLLAVKSLAEALKSRSTHPVSPDNDVWFHQEATCSPKQNVTEDKDTCDVSTPLSSRSHAKCLLPCINTNILPYHSDEEDTVTGTSCSLFKVKENEENEQTLELSVSQPCLREEDGIQANSRMSAAEEIDVELGVSFKSEQKISEDLSQLVDVKQDSLVYEVTEVNKKSEDQSDRNKNNSANGQTLSTGFYPATLENLALIAILNEGSHDVTKHRKHLTRSPENNVFLQDRNRRKTPLTLCTKESCDDAEIRIMDCMNAPKEQNWNPRRLANLAYDVFISTCTNLNKRVQNKVKVNNSLLMSNFGEPVDSCKNCFEQDSDFNYMTDGSAAPVCVSVSFHTAPTSKLTEVTSAVLEVDITPVPMATQTNQPMSNTTTFNAIDTTQMDQLIDEPILPNESKQSQTINSFFTDNSFLTDGEGSETGVSELTDVPCPETLVSLAIDAALMSLEPELSAAYNLQSS